MLRDLGIRVWGAGHDEAHRPERMDFHDQCGCVKTLSAGRGFGVRILSPEAQKPPSP